MAGDDTFDLLARTALFSALGDDDRRTVAAEMRPAAFEAGQAIFARGDAGGEIYLVKKGRVRLSVLTAEGRELSFAHAERGAVFGEIAMLDGGKRTADATAVSRVETMYLTKSAFDRLMEGNTGLAGAAIRFLCQRLREADQQLEAIALYPIEVRLARFFLAAARRKAPEKTGKPIPVSLDMSQTELALLIGASRPKVNAALAMLEESGAITRSGALVRCDMERLEASAAFET